MPNNKSEWDDRKTFSGFFWGLWIGGMFAAFRLPHLTLSRRIKQIRNRPHKSDSRTWPHLPLDR